MAGLYAPSGGITRLPKHWYAPDGSGITRNLKELWARDTGGVNRKIFSRGIPATYVGGIVDNGAGTIANYTDANNINFYGITGSSDKHSGAAYIRFTVPIDASAFAQNTPLISFNGPFTISNFTTVYDTTMCSITLYAGSVNDRIMGYKYFATNNANGSYTANVTLTRGAVPSSNYGYSTLEVLLDLDTNDDTAARGQLTFPWSNLIWLPTGEKFELAA